jgi:hypothetical protein
LIPWVLEVSFTAPGVSFPECRRTTKYAQHFYWHLACEQYTMTTCQCHYSNPTVSKYGVAWSLPSYLQDGTQVTISNLEVHPRKEFKDYLTGFSPLPDSQPSSILISPSTTDSLKYISSFGHSTVALE